MQSFSRGSKYRRVTNKVSQNLKAQFKSLQDLVDEQALDVRQPFWVLKKLSRHVYFPNVYQYSMSANTFEDDLNFLDCYPDENLEADLILANEYSDFGFTDLDEHAILRVAEKIKRLSICLEFAGIKSIERLSELEHLSLVELADTNGVPPKLDLNGLSSLRSLSLPVREKASIQINFGQLVDLEVLDFPHYRGRHNDFENFEKFENLKILDIYKCKVENLESLSTLVNLRLLVCEYAQNLKDISALKKMKKIERLDFQNCPNLSDLKILAELPNLKVLKLMNCPSISTLSFLKNTNLEFLEFINSTVKDNDVSFINEMPNLRMFRYSNKRAYCPQRKDTLGTNTTDLWRNSNKVKGLSEAESSDKDWRTYSFSRQAYIK